MRINEEAEQILSYFSSENHELSTRSQSLEIEKEKLENLVENLKNENEIYKTNENNLNEKFILIHNLFQEIKITLHSSFSISKVFIHKFNSIINEDLSHSYSKSFCEILTRLSRLSNFLPSETNPLDIIKNLEDFIRYMGTELEVQQKK